MKLSYYADTDSLYIDLSERPSVESREITGIVLDYDAEGDLVGIDIDHASRKVDLKDSPLINCRRSFKKTQANDKGLRRLPTRFNPLFKKPVILAGTVNIKGKGLRWSLRHERRRAESQAELWREV